MEQHNEQMPPPGEVSQVVEHLFRHEAGKVISALTRIFGFEHLSLAEDVVQEALARALQTWPYYGVPENPAGWITQVSRNLAYDVVRRDKVFRGKESQIVFLAQPQAPPDASVRLSGEFEDDRLRMIFVCCHAINPPEAQVALALKTLCGFSVEEISRAYLTTEAAIAKRLTRARQKIREANIPFEIPGGEELLQRLDGVLQTLYLLFNEGYKASVGEELVRKELCFEAIRMAELLVEHPAGNQPKTHALLALMLLNAARLATRTDVDGNFLRLDEQDRSKWDHSLIARGMLHFAQSAAGDDLSDYHIQAAISACHCSAATYEDTDWPQILSFYDRLIEADNSPVVALNRAIAVARVHGPAAGLDALNAIRDAEKLSSYYLLYAAFGEFEFELGNQEAAAANFRKALSLAEIKSEQSFLAGRLRSCRVAVHT